VLPGCDRTQTLNTAERIRSEIAGCSISTETADIAFTTSIGATVAESSAISPSEILAIADQALYQAKKTGRNRTVLV
jgi:two-component system cell cycle response regulator